MTTLLIIHESVFLKVNRIGLGSGGITKVATNAEACFVASESDRKCPGKECALSCMLKLSFIAE
jgi:hypothetical protein